MTPDEMKLYDRMIEHKQMKYRGIRMDKGDIDNLETAAEVAITRLGEEAYMWQKEAIMWRNRYSELARNIRSICLYKENSDG